MDFAKAKLSNFAIDTARVKWIKRSHSNRFDYVKLKDVISSYEKHTGVFHKIISLDNLAFSGTLTDLLICLLIMWSCFLMTRS